MPARKKAPQRAKSKKDLATRMAGYSVAAGAALIAQADTAAAGAGFGFTVFSLEEGSSVNDEVEFTINMGSFILSYSSYVGLNVDGQPGAEIRFGFTGLTLGTTQAGYLLTSQAQMVATGAPIITSNNLIKLFSNAGSALAAAAAGPAGLPNTAAIFTERNLYTFGLGTVVPDEYLEQVGLFNIGGHTPGTTGFAAFFFEGEGGPQAAWVELTIGSLTINSFGTTASANNANPVPEPGTLGLLAAGAAGMAAFRRRKAKAQAA